MKVSKVVLIVVALHVLVIGGIFIFEGCTRTQTKEPAFAIDESAPGLGTDITSPLPDLQQPPLPPVAANELVPASPFAATALTPSAPLAPAQPAVRTYTVKKGDSLWKIAQTEKISVGELAQANNLTKNSVLQIGQQLQIPAAQTETMPATASVFPTTADAAAPAVSMDTGASYTVKSGDSLWKLARQNNTTIAAIKQANNLTSDSLKIGQKLQIPAGTAGTTSASTTRDVWQPGTVMENGQTTHIVDIGETPGGIAKKYGIRTDDLMRVNNITNPRQLLVGQKLIIPGQQAPAPAVTTPTAAAPAATPPASATLTLDTTATPALAAPVVSTKGLRIN